MANKQQSTRMAKAQAAQEVAGSGAQGLLPLPIPRTLLVRKKTGGRKDNLLVL